MKHPYMMRCLGECGGFTQHVQRAHGSGEKLWSCTKCGAWTLAKPTRSASKIPAKNPITDDVRAARRLGREFSGHDPRRAARVRVQKPSSKVRLAVGEVTAIQYRARRDGRTDEYRHRFAPGSRPQLAVTPDGNHLELLGGAFRFTDRGIVDKRR